MRDDKKVDDRVVIVDTADGRKMQIKDTSEAVKFMVYQTRNLLISRHITDDDINNIANVRSIGEVKLLDRFIIKTEQL